MLSNSFKLYFNPQGYNNNRCSGYALASIIVEIFSHRNFLIKCNAKNKDLGMYFYDGLCTYQEELLRGYTQESVSMQFLNSPANIAGETCMIFPSALVHYCFSLGLTPTLFYSSERESIFQTEVFEEDCNRMKEFLTPVSGYKEFKLRARKYRYLLVLTRYKHWVALKSTKEGYYLFDPAPKEFEGGVFGPGTFETMLPEISEKYHSKYFYDILIGLCPAMVPKQSTSCG